MTRINSLIWLLIIGNILIGCSSTTTEEQAPTGFTFNINSSYYDTWDAVIKVLDYESHKIADKNKDRGVIVVRSMRSYTDPSLHKEYIKSLPPFYGELILNNLRFTIKGSDTISAVTIVAKYSYKFKPQRQSTQKVEYDVETSGGLEAELFKKIKTALK